MYLLKLLHSNFFKNQSKYYKGQKQCTYLHFSFKSSKLSLTCLSRRLQLLFKYNEIVFAESKVYFRPSNLPTTSTLIEFCLKNKKTNQNQSIKQKKQKSQPPYLVLELEVLLYCREVCYSNETQYGLHLWWRGNKQMACLEESDQFLLYTYYCALFCLQFVLLRQNILHLSHT